MDPGSIFSGSCQFTVFFLQRISRFDLLREAEAVNIDPYPVVIHPVCAVQRPVQNNFPVRFHGIGKVITNFLFCLSQRNTDQQNHIAEVIDFFPAFKITGAVASFAGNLGFGFRYYFL